MNLYKKKILIVVGTRPNFIKITRFKEIINGFPSIDLKIVHTGQHFDDKMASIFFEQFNLTPDYFLNISQGSANKQIAEIMIKLEDIIINQFKSDIILVVGDVNSTLAAALTANKLGIKIGHIESGLRSNDYSMPEEINRVITDKITSHYFVTEKSGYENLKSEGVKEEKIHFVGNTMIDTLIKFDKKIRQSHILTKLGLKEGQFVLMTMHRPATVDQIEGLRKLYELIEMITEKHKIVFPIHPRTILKLKSFDLYNLFSLNKSLIITEPLDYFSFQKLIKECMFILTDSGGIQEESTFRKIPCLTLRPNTERPITIDIGSNTLVPFEKNAIKEMVDQIESGKYKKGEIPVMWDGMSTERIIKILNSI